MNEKVVVIKLTNDEIIVGKHEDDFLGAVKVSAMDFVTNFLNSLHWHRKEVEVWPTEMLQAKYVLAK